MKKKALYSIIEYSLDSGIALQQLKFFKLRKFFIFLVFLYISSAIIFCSDGITVFYNGRILTLDGNIIHEAVAVRNDKIIYSGNNDQAMKFAGKNSVFYDLDSRTLIPGFHDSLMDFPLGSLMLEREYDMRGMNLTSGLELIRRRLLSTDLNQTLILFLFDQNNFNNRMWPSKYDLDKVSGARPVALIRKNGNAVLLNSAALKAVNINPGAGITGGGIQKFRDGSLKGILVNNAADIFFRSDIYKRRNYRDPTAEMIMRGMKFLNKLGITSVTTRGDIRFVNLLKKMERAGKLSIRFYIRLSSDNLGTYLINNLDLSGKGNFVRVGYLGIPFDGETGTSSAAMFSGYLNNGGYGYFITDPSKLKGILKISSSNKWQTGIRCQGDRALYRLISIVKELKRKKSAFSKKIRVENLKFVTDIDIKNLAKLKMIPVIFPNECSYEMHYYNEILPEREGEKNIPLRSFLDEGVVFAFGSGWPANFASPLNSIYFAVSRKTPDSSDGWFENEKIGFLDALRAYTCNSAYASNSEKFSGKIKRGFIADFTILEQLPKNLNSFNFRRILRLKTWMTVVGGKIVFRKNMN